MSGALHPLEPGTGRLIPGIPRAPWLWLSCSQGTSSFDEPITEPALRLPTGSRKVLFASGCWKGHGVLFPLLFLARALSPSDGKRSRALDPGHAVSVRPRPRRLVPGAAGALRGGCSVPARTLPTPPGLFTEQRNRCRAGGAVCHRLHGEVMGILGCCWNHLATNPVEVGLAPGVTGTYTLPR